VFVFSVLLPTLARASFDTSLKSGSSGSAVIALQNFLQTEGFLTGKIDGKFGLGTKKAVIAFQLANGLKGDGSFGLASRNKANSMLINGGIQNTGTNTKTKTSLTTTTPVIVVPFSGTLDLTENTSFTNPAIMPPQSNVKLADFTLTNNTTEVVNLSKIEADLTINSNPDIVTNYIKNLYIVYGNNKTTSLNAISPQNYFWPANFQLAVGKSVDVSIYGDINSSISLTSVINSSVLASGISAISKTAVYTNGDAVFSGQTISFSASSLTVGEDSSYPSSQIVIYNERVVAGAFQFTAKADSYNVSQMRFVIPSINNSALISDAVLKDTATGTTLATVPIKNNVSGNNSGFDFNGINISVPLNSSDSVTLYYDLSKNINSTDTNIDVSPILAYVRAVSSKGIVLDGAASNYSDFSSAYGGIDIPASGVTVSPLSIFKTIPKLTKISVDNTSLRDGSNINLYKFSIGANSSADVSIKQLTFTVNLSDPSNSNLRLNNFSFVKENSNSGSVTIGTINNDNFIGLNGSGGIDASDTNEVVVNFGSEEIIPAGKTETYTLKAYVTGLTRTDSISTTLASDGSLTGGSSLETVFSKFYDGLINKNVSSPTIAYYNFLWSDMSETSPNLRSEANGNSSNDWYNGSMVPGLPLAAETINAN